MQRHMENIISQNLSPFLAGEDDVATTGAASTGVDVPDLSVSMAGGTEVVGRRRGSGSEEWQ